MQYNYDYDANGNITKIWRGNTSFTNASLEKYSYVYDSANQPVRGEPLLRQRQQQQRYNYI